MMRQKFTVTMEVEFNSNSSKPPQDALHEALGSYLLCPDMDLVEMEDDAIFESVDVKSIDGELVAERSEMQVAHDQIAELIGN